jgi:iron-sulfur cluster repair protein YtfE (RIC family)
MSSKINVEPQIIEMIETETIRTIVELHPEVMPILAGHGLDLCCGGGHTIAEAVRLHELDADLVTEQIAAAISVATRD